MSESDEYPYFMFNEMTLDASKTYQLTFKVRGTFPCSFRMDVADIEDMLYPTNRTIIVPLFTVNVTTPTEGMIEFTTTFRPTSSSDNAYLRIVMGSATGVIPDGEIHLDDFELIELP